MCFQLASSGNDAYEKIAWTAGKGRTLICVKGKAQGLAARSMTPEQGFQHACRIIDSVRTGALTKAAAIAPGLTLSRPERVPLARFGTPPGRAKYNLETSDPALFRSSSAADVRRC